MTTYAVFGGTFDPPHLGHVAVPGYLAARGLADRVLVVPVYRHVWGKAARPFDVRHAWTKLAFRPLSPLARVLDLEADLAADGGGGTSWELMRALSKRLPGVRLRLVVGEDLASPGARRRYHRWEDLAAAYDPIVLPRPAAGGPLPAISSTQVRAALARGDWDTVRAWVPRPVYEHMRRGRKGWVGLVGLGHVARHVAPHLAERGFAVRRVRARSPGDLERLAGLAARVPPRAVYLTVADPALGATAERIAEAFDRAGVAPAVPVLHAAGRLPAKDRRALAALAVRGHPVGTLHPICSLRCERPWGDELSRAAFGVEGDPAAVDAARAFASGAAVVDLSGLSPSQRAAYHAACALVSNHLAVLRAQAALAVPEPLRRALACASDPLLESAWANLSALGPCGVTGPVARGDTAAVAEHVAALHGPAARVYRMLSDALADLLGRGDLPRLLPPAETCRVDRKGGAP